MQKTIVYELQILHHYKLYAIILLVIRMTFYGKYFEELTNVQVYEILKSRSEIFMLEQSIRCLDMDNVDYKSCHYFTQDGNRIIAYLRAFYPAEDKDEVKVGQQCSMCSLLLSVL